MSQWYEGSTGLLEVLPGTGRYRSTPYSVLRTVSVPLARQSVVGRTECGNQS